MATNQSSRIFSKHLLRTLKKSMLIAAIVACLLPQSLMAAIITSDVTGGKLTVVSDADDPISITCDTLQVKVNGADPNPATLCALINEIEVTGGPLQNTIDLNTVATLEFTTLVTVTVDGAGDSDVITGTFLADTLNGGAGNDRVIGHRGADTMNGDGDDDTMVWNPGDGSDIADGGDGNDTMEVNGGITETFTISASEGSVRFDRLSPAPFNVQIITTTENLILNANAGPDIVTGTTGLDGLILMTLNGGDGDDFITGGDGDDILNGDGGDDLLVGFRGADVMNGGANDDIMVWNPGDGSDVSDGGDGADVMVVNGGGVSETFTISATATGTLFDRVNPGPFSVDIFTTTEELELNGNGGGDIVTGTLGLSEKITLTLNGGDGNDLIKGGDGPDTLNGDNGDDTLIGFRGPDTMNGGPDNDTMIWNNGDGSDIMDGGDGDDIAIANGGAVSETFAITPAATLVNSVAVAGLNAPLVGSAFFQRVSPNPFSLDIEAEGFELNGNGGSDIFNVTPLISTTVDFDGGNAPVADEMIVDAQNLTVTLQFNTITVAGRQPVTHTDVESVEIINDPLPVKLYLPYSAWERIVP